jgi:hypothetical protein
MARHNLPLRCLRKTDATIVGKLNFIPQSREFPGPLTNYTDHADVGSCKGFSVRSLPQAVSFAEYQRQRRGEKRAV